MYSHICHLVSSYNLLHPLLTPMRINCFTHAALITALITTQTNDCSNHCLYIILPLNLLPLCSQPELRPFIHSGHLDTAVFDATSPSQQGSSMRLRQSGLLLCPDNPPVNGIVAVANYFFDSLPAAFFKVRTCLSCRLLVAFL